MEVLKLNEWVQTRTDDKDLYNENGSYFSFLKKWKNYLNNEEESWVYAIDTISANLDDNKSFSFYVDCSGSMEPQDVRDIFNEIYSLIKHGYNNSKVYSFNQFITPVINNKIPLSEGGTIPFIELLNHIEQTDASEINIIITDCICDFNVNEIKSKINELYNKNIKVFVVTNEPNMLKILKDVTPVTIVVDKNYTTTTTNDGNFSNKQIVPKNKNELKSIIEKRIKNKGNNCDLNDIDVSKITDMSCLFENSEFNGNISNWDVSNVIDMSSMFEDSEFNGDISKWDVSNVQTMHYMFAGSYFNQDISTWNVSNVEIMSSMFYHSRFNGDISNWDVRNVKTMYGMFYDSYFNGDISNWIVSKVHKHEHMFNKCPLEKYPEKQPKFID